MRLRVLVGLAIVAAAIGACVIAEPATDLPTLPAQTPIIVRSAVVPPPNAVLTTWPEKFFVPVRLSDSQETVLATYFVDWNPVTSEGFDNYQLSGPPATGSGSNPRTLEVQITQPSHACHLVEVVVALPFTSQVNTSDFATLHNPPNGSDSTVWFYSPNGDLAGCPVFDAGAPDAQTLESLGPESGIP